MTLHYHGTPITPRAELEKLTGRHFTVSFARPDQVKQVHEIAQSVMLDNGAYSIWQGTGEAKTDWSDYYKWAERWLVYRSTWAVMPDIIGGSELDNDRLLKRWPLGKIQGAPVWHVNESFARLKWLCSSYPRVCFGSAGEFAVVGSPRWVGRIAAAFTAIVEKFGRVPVWVHMLRGMSLSGGPFPFSSVDSSDLARNWHRSGDIVSRADRWDSLQCPATWEPFQQLELLAGGFTFPVDNGNDLLGRNGRG